MYTSFERSVNARKQLRGKDGRWIYEGGSVKWFDALKGIMRAGVVDSFNGDYVNVKANDGGTSKVHRSNITAIPKKATLGGSGDSGYTKPDFDAAPVGSTATIKTPAQKGGDSAKSITVTKQKDGNWFEKGFSEGVGKTYSSEQLAGEKAEIADLAADPSETAGPRDISSWQKGKNLGGSNGAAIYTDEEGNEYAVKFLKSDDHAKNEVLASRLYDLAGTPTPGQELITKDGKIGIASPMVPGVQGDLSAKLKDEDYLNKLRKDFAVDAWLANWDVAGLSYDNVITDENGDPIRIDPGGSLLYRAMGTPKGDAFGTDVGEWDTLRTSAQGKNVFGNMTDEQAIESAKKLQTISDTDIDEIVDSVDFDDATATKLKETLKARRDDVLKRAGLSQDGTSTIQPKAELPAETADEEPKAQPFTDKDSILEYLNKVGIDNYINATVEDYESIPLGFWKTRKGQVGDVYTPHTDQDTYKILIRQLPNKNGDYWETIDENGKISNTTVSHVNQSLLRPNVLPNTEEAPEADTEPSEAVFSVLPEDQRGASGDGYHESGPWGKFGASGLVMHAEDSDKYFIVQRGGIVSSNKGKWQLPGGAMEENENAYQGAARELIEETSFTEDQLKDLTHVGDVVFDNGKGWTYTNIGANLPTEIDIKTDPKESAGGKWVTAEELRAMRDNDELVPAFGKNVDNILDIYSGGDKEETVEVSEADAEDIALEPAAKVQGIGGKATGTGIPTSDNGQGIVSHDHSEVSLSGVPKGKTTKDPMDIQSAGIGQKLYDPESDLEFERLDVDTWEDSTGVKYTVPEMSSLAKADGFIWGSKEDFMGQAPKLLSDDEPAPAGKVPDNDKEYEWSEVNQLVADFYANVVPGSNDDVVNYKLVDGTSLLLSNTQGDPEGDGIEILPPGKSPMAKNWLGPINWREALQSKDISEDIENLIFGGSASDPDSEPRLSTGAADLNSLPEGSVVKFGDASDSKVYLKNADGSWSASWLDDNHPQKNVTSDQIHAVAAYLGKDVQVMKEDGEPNPQSQEATEPELAQWEKELLFGNPVGDFEVGDFFYLNGNLYTKEGDNNWLADDLNGLDAPMTDSEVIDLLFNENHTPEKNVVPEGAKAPAQEATGPKNSELLEKLGLDPSGELGDFLDSAPIGSEITIKEESGPGLTILPSTYVKKAEGEWYDKDTGEEWDEISLNGSYDPTNVIDFVEGDGEDDEQSQTPADIYGITESNFKEKLDEFPVGTSINMNDGGQDYTYYKIANGEWEPEFGGISHLSDEIAGYYKVEDLTNVGLGNPPEDTPAAPAAETPQDILNKYGITENNLTQKYTEFPEGTQIDFKTGGGTEASFIKESDGQWHKDDASIAWEADELEDKFYAYEIKNITVPETTNVPKTSDEKFLADLINLGDSPDIAKTVDGINYDSSGNAWVPDKSGKALRVGSIVTSKAGEKGKIDYIQKGGQKVRVKTEDGNTKFWMAHLVDKADPSVPFDDSNNKYVIHEDDQGNQYLTNPDGDNIYVGDTVVSSGKTGFEGVVTGFKSGEFVLVQDPSDGKVKPRKIDKIKLVSSANPAPAPESKPAAITPVPGEKVTSVDELDAAPAGTSVKPTANNPTGTLFFRKNTDGKWYTTINGTRTEGGDLDSSAFQNHINNGTLEWFDPDATSAEPDTTEKAVGDVFESAEDLDNLPMGTVISVPDWAQGKWLFEKDQDGMWIDVTDPNDKGTHQYKSSGFKQYFTNGTGLVHSLPGQPAQTTPAQQSTGLQPGDNLSSLTKEEFMALPVGFEVELDDPAIIYTKQDNGTWTAITTNGNPTQASDSVVWSIVPGGSLSVPKKSSTNSQSGLTAGNKVASFQEFKTAPIGTVVKTSMGSTYTKTADNGWQYVEANGKFSESGAKYPDSDFESLADGDKITYQSIGTGTITQSAQQSGTDKPGTIAANNYDEIAALPVGSVIYHSTNENETYEKTAPNQWKLTYANGSESTLPFDDSDFEPYAEEGHMLWHQTSPNVAGSTPQATPAASEWDNWNHGDVPTNVTAEMVEALPGGATFLRLPNGNFLWRKNDDGTWTRVSLNSGNESKINFDNDDIASFFEDGKLQVHKPNAAATSQPAQPSLPGKNGKNVAVGATVSYNTPKKSKKGKVVEIDEANGDAIFVDDATGKKAKHKAKFLTVEEEAPQSTAPAPQTSQAAPTPTKDPSSPWYEKAEPVAPVEPSGVRKDFAMDGLFEELSEGYKTDKGKEFTNSSYHPLFEQLSKNGSLTIPGNFNKNEAKYGPQSDLLDFFRARGYISQETADKARAHFNVVDAHNKTLMKDHADKVSQYSKDLLDWKKANGVPLSGFYSETFQLSKDADEILTKMKDSKVSGKSAADANIPYTPTKKDKNALLTWKGSSNPSSPGDPDYVPSISWSGLSVALRTGGETTLHDTSSFSQDQQAVIKALDEAIDNSELTEELIITRTGSFKNFTLPNGKAATSIADLKAFEGSVVTDYGFIAASPGSTAGYAATHEVDIRIRMPKGSKGAWLGGKNKINVGENEILLPRGSRFYIHEAKPSSSGSYYGKAELIVDLVPADWTPAAGQTTQAVNPSAPSAPSSGGPTTPPTQTPYVPTSGPGVWV